jgi:Protein of unknown function (DUF1064)
MNKYRAKRHNGYASRKEANCAADFQALARAGKIQEYQEQVRFEILPPFAEYKRPLIYIADFSFIEDGRRRVIDAKGFRTPVFKLKKRLMKQLLGIEIEEI